MAKTKINVGKIKMTAQYSKAGKEELALFAEDTGDKAKERRAQMAMEAMALAEDLATRAYEIAQELNR